LSLRQFYAGSPNAYRYAHAFEDDVVGWARVFEDDSQFANANVSANLDRAQAKLTVPPAYSSSSVECGEAASKAGDPAQDSSKTQKWKRRVVWETS
jgi:hypothetical protein